ncbi:hypothetical protein ACIHEI_19520 [Kitasatospora sp. NPDC051984]|uniref:hypothetical protein n=1 Tax=Kitasatospora sp. NPDC051984 TaxID=3364059 RepID=UPI0037CAB3B9
MPALPEQDFEDRLCQVFRETGDSFVPDTPLLAMVGAARGRRRHRRRLALGSAAAVLAVSGVTAVVLPNALYTDSVGPAASVAPTPADSRPSDAGIPEEAHLVSAVAERLPAGLRIVRSNGSTFGATLAPFGSANAQLTLEDGQGPSLLTLDITNTTGWGPAHSCAGYDIEGVTCVQTAEDDGTKVAVTQWTGADPGPTPHRYSEVQVDAPDGTRVTATSFNSATHAGDSTRPDPLLTVDRLRTLATDPGWRTFKAMLRPAVTPKDPPERVQQPDLLPAGLQVVSSTGPGGPMQRTMLAAGDRMVELTVVEEQAEPSVESWFADAPAQPDGTRVRSVTGRPVPNAQGATETIVDVLGRDGHRVRVTAVNPAGAGSPDAGRPPLLTLDQLTAIATCPGWTVPHPK